MDEFRNELSNREKIARAVSGIESNAIFNNMDDKELDKLIEANKRAKWNEGVKKIEDRFADHENKLQEAANEYAKKLNNVQIMPVCNYVIVRPFVENPFQKITVDEKSGLILDTGGLIPEVQNNQTGDYEEAEQMIKTGVVIEAGPECKFLRSGDTIMWTKMSEVVIPFYNFGFRLVNETRAICVINDDLNERFNLNK